MSSHRNVAESWYRGQKDNGSRMYSDGKVIFSYGSHFPIAVHMKGFILFNTDSYSSSTATHKSYVRSLLYGDEVIKCNTEEIKRAINYPDQPIIITKKVDHDYESDILDELYRLHKSKGIKKYPIKKVEKVLDMTINNTHPILNKVLDVKDSKLLDIINKIVTKYLHNEYVKDNIQEKRIDMISNHNKQILKKVNKFLKDLELIKDI